MGRTSIYFAEERDLYDLYESAKKRVTSKYLLDLALSRGIILSEATPREELVRFMSQLPHDESHVDEVVDVGQRHLRTPKKNVSTITTQISPQELKAILSRLDQERDRLDETFELHRVAQDDFKLNLVYTEHDHSCTRLKQRQEVVVDIEFKQTDAGFEVQYPALPHVHGVFEDMVESLKKASPGTTERTISLAGLASQGQRTRFFVELAKGMRGFKFNDVTTVRVNNPKELLTEDSLDDEMNEDDNQALELVRSVLIDGKQLLRSDEFKALQAKNFGIARLVWTCTERGHSTGPLFEIEASVSDEFRTGSLIYLVRGEYNWSEQNNRHTKNRRRCSSIRQTQLETSVIESAWKTLETIGSTRE